MAQVVPGVAPNPATTPWQVDLPDAIEPLQPTDLFTDAYRIPQGTANTAYGECGRNRHQRWNDFFGNPQLQPGQADTYELRVKEDNNYSFHRIIPISWRGLMKVWMETVSLITTRHSLRAMGVR